MKACPCVKLLMAALMLFLQSCGNSQLAEIEKARSAENRGTASDAEILWQALLDKGQDAKDDELIRTAAAGLFREYCRHRKFVSLAGVMKETMPSFTKDSRGKADLKSLIDFAHVHMQVLYDERDLDNCAALCAEVAVINNVGLARSWDPDICYMYDRLARRRMEHGLYSVAERYYLDSLRGFRPDVPSAALAADNLHGLALCAEKTGNYKSAIITISGLLAEAAAAGGSESAAAVRGPFDKVHIVLLYTDLVKLSLLNKNETAARAYFQSAHAIDPSAARSVSQFAQASQFQSGQD